MPVRLHAPAAAHTGVGELDGAPGLLRAGRPVLLGLEIEPGATLLAHGGGSAGWEALVRVVGARLRRRTGEATAAGALVRLLGERAAAVTVLLGPGSSIAQASTREAARAAFAEWRDVDVAIAVGSEAVRMLRLARDVGATAVLVHDQPAVDPAPECVPEVDRGLLAPESAAVAPPPPVPPSAMRTHARIAAARADASLASLLDATERLAARCLIDPALDLRWGAPPPAVDVPLDALRAAGLEFALDGAGLVVEHGRVDEAVALLAAAHPGAALLPDGGIVLDGAAVPRRGRRHGLPLSAFDRAACTGLGLATIGVLPDTGLSALAHARREAHGSTLPADELAAAHPAAALCGALEFSLEPPVRTVATLGVSVAASGRTYRVEGDAVRAPLRLAGLTDDEVERILAGRPFRSLDDFHARAAPARARMLRLAAEGALDALLPGVERAGVIARVRALGSAPAPSDGPVEPTLFAGLDVPLPPPPPPPHAIESYRPMLDELEVRAVGSLADARPGAEVLVAGIRIAGDRAPRGSAGLSVRLEDGSGVADCAFPEGAQRAVGALLSNTRLMLVQGRTREGDDERVSVEAENAWDLKRMWADWTASRRRSA